MDIGYSGSPEGQMRPYAYPLVIRLLHWISAAVIIWAMVSGFWAASLASDDGVRHGIGNFNAALTALFIPIFGFRVAVRFAIPKPSYVTRSKRLNGMAGLAHAALYVLTSLTLITGIMCLDHQVDLFGLADLRPVVMSEEMRASADDVHRGLCKALGLLILLHIGAVSWHMANGRNVWARMSIKRSAVP